VTAGKLQTKMLEWQPGA